MELCEAIPQVDRDTEEDDRFLWPCAPSGSFSASSTYERLCQGGERFATADCIWKSKATLKCKIFQWLAIKRRLWTTDRRARHGLQEFPNACFLCLQEIDSVEHILVQCPYAREVWFRCFRGVGLTDFTPTIDDELEFWWLRVRARFRGKEKRQFDSQVILICWSLWKQRNARAFNNASRFATPEVLVRRIDEEARLWGLAGVGVPSSIGE